MKPLLFAAIAAVLSLAAAAATTGATPRHSAVLRGPGAFAGIRDKAARSRALFKEAGKVIQSPRCLNCHPRGDSPHVGDAMVLHHPPVVRGDAANLGAPGMRCGTCHQQANVDPAGVPGAPGWRMAPKEMAWFGKSLAEICTQIKDPKRNGGRDMDAIIEHVTDSKLVGWAWHPGGTRRPAPGEQKTFARLITAWAHTGAHCPHSALSR